MTERDELLRGWQEWERECQAAHERARRAERRNGLLLLLALAIAFAILALELVAGW